MAKEKFVKAYEPGEFEAEIYQAWEQAGTFQPDKRETERGTFSLVMPPPNANGNLHIGHGLTIATEDAMARYHRMRGEATWYVPGADHAGFETWVVYERELEKHGKTRFQYSRDELYANVWDFVQEQRGNMELQLRALGASCAWNDLTFTLDENVVRRTYKTFEKMWKDGMIYRGEKLVNYCPKHQTAFADIEVEYKEDTGHLWDIAYPIPGKHPSASSADALLAGRAESPAHSGAPASSHLDASLKSDGDERNSENVKELTEIIVSTTRPETLFGDTAVAVNPEDKRYKGMKGQKVVLPLTGRTIPVIYDEHADPEYGTGAVKITPAHDYDDFQVGERHDLARIRVIDDEGRMMNCGEEYDGLTTEECRKKVLKELKKAGLLRGEKKIKHAVGHCYKCGAVIEPTLKEQWFIDTSKLAAGAIEHIEKDEIKFFPAQKKKVLVDYLRGLKDWNISRQIPWGIAIPMFRRADLVLGAPTEVDLDDDGTSDVSSSAITVSGEVAPEWVFDTRVNLTEIEVNGVKYIRDEDTFDTWFSSSHWPIVCTDFEDNAPSSSSEDALLAGRAESPAHSGAPSSSNTARSLQNQEIGYGKNPFYPLDVMETGADILFAWVARMIMMGVYVTGEVPFRNVYLHGLVLDEHGQKMSKSKGNVINPMDLVAKYGSDAFRMGILRGRGAGMNQAFSEESVKAGRNMCNKIWNIGRLVQKIVDENFETQEVATVNMGEDWICREITEALVEIEKQMKQFRFAEAVETVQSLVWDKYADWFLESQKIYKNSSLLKATFEAILKILHPFAPFVTEAIWQNLSWTDGMIITASWPEFMKYDPISAENFEKIIEVVTAIRQVQAELPGGFTKARKYGVIIGDDSLVDDNSLLVAQLAHVDSIRNAEGAPSGLRLPVANREIYLDVPPEVVEEYREKLDEKILAVGAELDGLNARMMNPRYVDRAPAELVEETRRGIEEKERLIERLKTERSAI